ncbi:conserved hypothetical protein, partial [methanotrophic bacterial endosymbiont of Bathymodiolus sp.]
MPENLSQGLADLDWNFIQQSLDEHGYAKLPGLLSNTECKEIISTYEEEIRFRTTIDMAR